MRTRGAPCRPPFLANDGRALSQCTACGPFAETLRAWDLGRALGLGCLHHGGGIEAGQYRQPESDRVGFRFVLHGGRKSSGLQLAGIPGPVPAVFGAVGTDTARRTAEPIQRFFAGSRSRRVLTFPHFARSTRAVHADQEDIQARE